MTDTPPAFFLGKIPVHGELILAPMDGICDIPFRSLCRRFGSALSYVPFLHAREILERRPSALSLLGYLDQERPLVFQLYDNEEENLLQAAQFLQEHQPDAIDINMACSVRGISTRGAGAGLLRDPKKAGRIMRRLNAALEVPVSAKMRLGWDAGSLNYLEISRALEENGAALIAVHGRTRQQRFEGRADWNAIAAVKQAVSIPVLANGDVCTPDDIRRIQALTKCDGIMIGRAAIGNPWIFSRRARAEIPRDEVAAVLHMHIKDMLDQYPEQQAILRFRKHLVRYIEPYSLPDSLRERLIACTDFASLSQALATANLAS